MGYQDLHLKPFDESTLTKLELFEDYADAWLPKFIMTDSVKEIHIFDFFSGPGFDQNNIPGSPIRILSKIVEQLNLILSKKTRISIHLNEFNSEKFKLLKQNCEILIQQHPKLNYYLDMNYYNEDTATLFPKLLPLIKKFPSLVFLDQNGVRFISNEYLLTLEKLKTTDFLFFVSSSFFKRLGTTPEFQKVIPFTKQELIKIEWSNIHRVVVEKLKSVLSSKSSLNLYPFTIKKGANIYGVIFGASHPAAVDKFLKICWKKNKNNGEANFDIDRDATKKQRNLFEDCKLTKVEQFKLHLKNKVLSGEITNNKDALNYTYSTGNYYVYANDLLKNLHKFGKINYEGRTPGISYDNVYKKKKRIRYIVK